MSDLQLYSKISCYYNNKLQSEEIEVSIKRITGAQIQKTVQKGFAGLSPGAPMLEITLKSGIPATGFEVPTIGQDMLLTRVVEFTFFAGGKTLTTKGFVIDDTSTHGSEKPAEIDYTAQCQFSDWG
jgi:hypothetical protein